MLQQFINREAELAFLNERLLEHKPQLLIFYGRRRVGKTHLLAKFMESKPQTPSIYFLAGKKRWIDNIRELQSRMAEMVDEPLFSTAEFTDYIELFREFSKRFKEQIIIVIDEFPSLHDPKRDIESMFQKIYDEIISESKISLILCGSSVSMMESLLGYKSPLYGRRTGQWLVEPLRFKDACKFVPKYDIQGCIETYAILGGIPFYLSMFNDRNSVLKNIENMLLSKGSVLQREPEFLLMEEVREPRNYFLILKAIAFGNTRSSEIISTTGLDKSVVSRYIDVLHNLSIVKRSTPITIKKENVRDIRYYLEDNLFNFWFKFIYPNEAQIEYGNTDVLIQTIKSQLGVHTSFVFEDISREFLYEIIDDLPFRFERIGKWWHKDNEIDLVAFNEGSRDIMFVECKWKYLNERDADRVLAKLRKKSGSVQWNNDSRHEYYGLVAKKIEGKERLRESGYVAFDLDDM